MKKPEQEKGENVILLHSALYHEGHTIKKENEATRCGIVNFKGRKLPRPSTTALERTA